MTVIHSLVLRACFLLLALVVSVGSVHGKKPDCVTRVKLPIYLKTYGSCLGKPLVYLHGGPGDSAHLFEHTAARKLAKEGFFVVVYDRRGTGRSPKAKSTAFTFAAATKDLYEVLQQLKITKEVSLLGHSFGGAVGLHFLASYPKVKARLILVGAPLSYPATLRTLLDVFIGRYPAYIAKAKQKKQSYFASMMQRAMVYSQRLKKEMFKAGTPVKGAFTMRRVGFIFMTALRFRLYTPKVLSKEARALYASLAANRPPKPSAPPFMGFLKNEQYAERSYGNLVKAHRSRVYGIYGRQDGLFSAGDLKGIQTALGAGRCQLVAGAGHNPFVDQQSTFVALLKRYTK